MEAITHRIRVRPLRQLMRLYLLLMQTVQLNLIQHRDSRAQNRLWLLQVSLQLMRLGSGKVMNLLQQTNLLQLHLTHL